MSDSTAPPDLDVSLESPDKSTTAKRFRSFRMGPLGSIGLVLALIGIAVPLGLLTLRASTHPVSFDGAMNLQVAQHVADGEGFVRDYGRSEPFPDEIQTSGYYIIGEALALAALGPSQLSYNAGNLLAALAIALAVLIATRRSSAILLFGPLIVLFAVPGGPEFGTGGYGEYVVAAAVLMTLLILSRAGESPRRSLESDAFMASAVLGVALTIKTVVVAALPLLVLGLLMATIGQPLRRRVRVGAAAAAGFVLPILVFEAYRAISLGSIAAYRAYWGEQFRAIAYQSGVKSDSESSLFETGRVHLDMLAARTDLRVSVLLTALIVPLVLVSVIFFSRTTSFKDWLREPVNRLMVLLGTYASLYLVWWFFITPTEKAWLRRIVIGLLCLAFLYILAASEMVANLRDSGEPRPSRPRRTASGVGLVAVAVVGMTVAVPTILRQVSEAATTDRQSLTDLRSAGDWVRQTSLARTMYGVGWWSAPTVSLESDVSFKDLQLVNPCEVTPGDVVIWDFYAQNLSSPEPIRRGLEFTRIKDFGRYASAFSIGRSAECVSSDKGR